MSDEPINEVLTAALAAYDAGLCPIRPETDGTKRPKAVPHHGRLDPATNKRGKGWEAYQFERPSRFTVEGWFSAHPGLGIVCGEVSGHLQMLELEGRMTSDESRLRRFFEALDDHDARDTWNRMTTGYRESTPGGGMHTMARVPGHVAGNVVLARCMTEGGPRPLIETRGDGGFTVVAPSNGSTHPTGRPWTMEKGGFDSIATITVEEWNAVLAAAVECNEVASAEPSVPAARRLTMPAAWAGGVVGESWMDVTADHLEANGGVLGILLRHGWTHWMDTPEMVYVTRPVAPDEDKQGGVSAQIKRANGRLLNYSSSVTEFETWPTFRGNPPTQVPTRSYDAADVLAIYEFDGDRDAALRAVAKSVGIYDAWLAERAVPDDAGDDRRSSKSVATQIVELAQERFVLGVGTDGVAFGLAKDGPNIARPLRGGRLGLRAALAQHYMEVKGKAPTAGALADALLVIEGRCGQCEPIELHMRVAPWGDAIVIDLGTPDGRAVVIEPTGWKIVDRSPVTFRRSELTMPLPEPERAGIDLMAEPIGNISVTSWPLVVGWLVAALMRRIPHPILLLRGEQGTGKSTMATTLGALIDPTAAPLRSSPRDIEQWAVAASGSWSVALDNITSIASWFSDALCRAVTGEGTVRRKLYSDDDVSVIAFRRVILLTAIDAGAMRGDLADRLMPVDLDTIAPSDRRTDGDLADQLADKLPGLLGALYDLTADVLAELPKVDLPEMPRMADFAKVLEAVGRVRRCVGPTPLSLYRGLQQDLAREVVEGDPFALAIAEMVKAQSVWVGTAGELGRKVAVPDPRPRGWPTSPRAISGAVGRLAPALRAIGIAVERGQTPGSGSRKTITLRLEGLADDA